MRGWTLLDTDLNQGGSKTSGKSVYLYYQTGSGPAKIAALLNLRTADWLVRALRHRRRNDGKQPPVVREHLDLSASTAAR